MTVPRMIELALAVAILAAGVWLYRRKAGADANYGSQGAVILLVVAVILAVHALGWLDYHPSAGEIEVMKAQGQ
jgi:hypothetical protein